MSGSPLCYVHEIKSNIYDVCLPVRENFSLPVLSLWDDVVTAGTEDIVNAVKWNEARNVKNMKLCMIIKICPVSTE